MAKTKYDWAAIRVAFFESEYSDVSGFLEDKLGAYNAHTKKKTVGWAIEKKAWLKEQSEQLLKDIANNRTKEAKKALDLIFSVVIDDIKAIKERRRASVRSGETLGSLWRMVRTEAGLPSAITKQENIDLDELEEARQLLDEKLQHEQKPISKPRTGKKPIPKRRKKKSA